MNPLRIFLYGLSIIGLTLLIILFDVSNTYLVSTTPGFPFWLLPLACSVVLISVGAAIWNKIRGTDLLKYEFIAIVTHKFRTPLTTIKWSSENLIDIVADNQKEDVKNIQNANFHLVELTNLLMSFSDTDAQSYQYKLEAFDLRVIISDMLTEYEDKAKVKDIAFTVEGIGANAAMFPIAPARVLGDKARIQFIAQTFLDNAMSYTPSKGSVAAKLIVENKQITFSVRDSGIGIAKEEMSHLFTKFYRAADARKADTEGMGIGLYMTKKIAAKHHGRVWVESEGAGKGSTFFLMLPLVQSPV